jgi:hypothetical protein
MEINKKVRLGARTETLHVDEVNTSSARLFQDHILKSRTPNLEQSTLSAHREPSNFFPKVTETQITDAISKRTVFTKEFNFAHPDLPIYEHTQLVQKALLGTSVTRPFLWKPNQDNSNALCSYVIHCIENNLPIEAVMFYGARKTFGVVPDYIHADIADLLAFSRIVETQNAVASIYKPGFAIQIVLEDQLERALYGNRVKDLDMHRYCCDLKLLAAHLDANIKIDMQSALIQNGGEEIIYQMTENQFMQFADHVTELFVKYWRESKTKNLIPEDEGDRYSGYQKLKSFHKLEEIGWKGAINSKQRTWFIARAKNELGENSSQDDIEYFVCRDLAVSFARSVLYRHNPKFFNPCQTFTPSIRLSFLTHAPGTPIEAQNMCLFKSMRSSANSKSNHAPWIAKGGCRVNADGSIQATTIGHRKSLSIPNWAQAKLILENKYLPSLELRTDLFCT